MSHFATYKANVSNINYLKKALEEMNFSVEENVSITDYYNQTQKVDLRLVDLPVGFKWNEEEKKYDVIADWWGTKLREKEFCSQVSQLHEKYKVEDICEKNNLIFSSWETLEDGSIQLEAMQNVY